MSFSCYIKVADRYYIPIANTGIARQPFTRELDIIKRELEMTRAELQKVQRKLEQREMASSSQSMTPRNMVTPGYDILMLKPNRRSLTLCADDLPACEHRSGPETRRLPKESGRLPALTAGKMEYLSLIPSLPLENVESGLIPRLPMAAKTPSSSPKSSPRCLPHDAPNPLGTLNLAQAVPSPDQRGTSPPRLARPAATARTARVDGATMRASARGASCTPASPTTWHETSFLGAVDLARSVSSPVQPLTGTANKGCAATPTPPASARRPQTARNPRRAEGGTLTLSPVATARGKHRASVAPGSSMPSPAATGPMTALTKEFDETVLTPPPHRHSLAVLKQTPRPSEPCLPSHWYHKNANGTWTPVKAHVDRLKQHMYEVEKAGERLILPVCGLSLWSHRSTRFRLERDGYKTCREASP